MSDSRVALLLGQAALPTALADAGWTGERIEAAALLDRLEAATGRVVVITDEATADAFLEDEATVAMEPEVPQGIHVRAMGETDAPTEQHEGPLPGWQQGLAAMKGSLDRGFQAILPDAFQRLAPVRQVLEGAGERRVVRTESGESWVACGFPDLVRPGAKVLLVRDTEDGPEMVALHRHPKRVGVCGAREDDGYLPGADWDPDPLAKERTGAALPTWGRLVALESDAVYTERGGKVYRWDGRRETEAGTRSQALATLVLRWSQR